MCTTIDAELQLPFCTRLLLLFSTQGDIVCSLAGQSIQSTEGYLALIEI